MLWGERDEQPGAIDLNTGLDPFAKGTIDGVGEVSQLRGAGQAFISETGEWIGTDDAGKVVAIDLRFARGRHLEARPKQAGLKNVGWGPSLTCEERCRLTAAPSGSPTWLRAAWVPSPEGDGSLFLDGAWLLLHYERLDRDSHPRGLGLTLLAPDGAVRWTYAGFPPKVRHVKATHRGADRLVVVAHANGDEGIVVGLDAATGQERWRQRL